MDGRYEFVLVDSLNKRLLDTTDEELWRIVQDGHKARVAMGKKLNQHEQVLYFQQVRAVTSWSNCYLLVVEPFPLTTKWLILILATRLDARHS